MNRERRAAPRRFVHDPVDVTDCLNGTTIGRIGNLSRNGLMLICRQPLRDGALYQLRFRLHETGQDIEAGVQAMWIDDASTNGYQWSGLRIISISAQAAASLDNWLCDRP